MRTRCLDLDAGGGFGAKLILKCKYRRLFKTRDGMFRPLLVHPRTDVDLAQVDHCMIGKVQSCRSSCYNGQGSEMMRNCQVQRKRSADECWCLLSSVTKPNGDEPLSMSQANDCVLLLVETTYATANVQVAASSTRAPIHRTLALQNNLADVTAKSESVANLADIAGTLLGIALCRMNARVVPTFMLLSAGYLYASRQEINSVVFPYLNRARLAVAASTFLATGSVPSVLESNRQERLLPWGEASSLLSNQYPQAAAFHSPKS